MTRHDQVGVALGAAVEQSQFLRGDQGRGGEQGLGDGGVGDLLGGALGPEAHEVEPDEVTEVRDALADAGELQPRGEHAGGLRTLPGRDDRDHVGQSPTHARPNPSSPRYRRVGALDPDYRATADTARRATSRSGENQPPWATRPVCHDRAAIRWAARRRVAS